MSTANTSSSIANAFVIGASGEAGCTCRAFRNAVTGAAKYWFKSRVRSNCVGIKKIREIFALLVAVTDRRCSYRSWPGLNRPRLHQPQTLNRQGKHTQSEASGKRVHRTIQYLKANIKQPPCPPQPQQESREHHPHLPPLSTPIHPHHHRR